MLVETFIHSNHDKGKKASKFTIRFIKLKWRNGGICVNIFENKKVEVKQLWEGKEFSFAPDASPIAFEHYKKHYKLNGYNFEKLYFYNYNKENKMYENIPLQNCFNRLNVTVDNPPTKNINNITFYYAVLRISGDTDFNFKEDENKCSNKYDRYLQLLRSSYAGEELSTHIKTLNYCKDMHYTLLNFSLIQVIGNMQGAKSKGFHNDWLDRLDSFVYMLDVYYHTKVEERINSFIIQNSSACNQHQLMSFLNEFADSIEDYCKKSYFIDKEMVKKLIDSGNKRIDSGKRLVEYMNLAIEFWQHKKFHFLKKNI